MRADVLECLLQSNEAAHAIADNAGHLPINYLIKCVPEDSDAWAVLLKRAPSQSASITNPAFPADASRGKMAKNASQSTLPVLMGQDGAIAGITGRVKGILRAGNALETRAEDRGLLLFTSSMTAVKVTAEACRQASSLLDALLIDFEERDIFVVRRTRPLPTPQRALPAASPHAHVARSLDMATLTSPRAAALAPLPPQNLEYANQLRRLHAAQLASQREGAAEVLDGAAVAAESSASSRKAPLPPLPQLYLNGGLVGSLDELRALDDEGELGPLLEPFGPRPGPDADPDADADADADADPASKPGKLGPLLEPFKRTALTSGAMHREGPRDACEVCGGKRFVVCSECNGSRRGRKVFDSYLKCSHCNENGLQVCQACKPEETVQLE